MKCSRFGSSRAPLLRDWFAMDMLRYAISELSFRRGRSFVTAVSTEDRHWSSSEICAAKTHVRSHLNRGYCSPGLTNQSKTLGNSKSVWRAGSCPTTPVDQGLTKRWGRFSPLRRNYYFRGAPHPPPRHHFLINGGNFAQRSAQESENKNPYEQLSTIMTQSFEQSRKAFTSECGARGLQGWHQTIANNCSTVWASPRQMCERC